MGIGHHLSESRQRHGSAGGQLHHRLRMAPQAPHTVLRRAEGHLPALTMPAASLTASNTSHRPVDWPEKVAPPDLWDRPAPQTARHNRQSERHAIAQPSRPVDIQIRRYVVAGQMPDFGCPKAAGIVVRRQRRVFGVRARSMRRVSRQGARKSRGAPRRHARSGGRWADFPPATLGEAGCGGLRCHTTAEPGSGRR